MAEVPVDAVGKRVSCGGERATVRYFGPVPPTAGLWLGVEWDSPDRGKHDGSHEGVQYFTCRHPTGGSFVRPAKVSFGVDYLTAVRQAYKIDSEEVLSEEISISRKKLKWGNIKERGYDAVWSGEERHTALFSLPSVLLSRSDVSGSGADGQIRTTTPNVEWLDLSGTLLSCWEDVATISQQLDRLEGLQLSYNRLRLPPDPSALRHAFSALRVLVLNGCQLTWPQVRSTVALIFTFLSGLLQSLKSLSLSSNPLVQDSVLSLSALPRYCTKCQPCVDWFVVNELAKLPSLVRLSCRGNKLVSGDGNPKTANQMLIAKLEQLVVLNGCEIHADDRRGAELDYIKMFGEEWLKAGGRSQPSPQFVCEHPRYQALISKYGAPEEGELKKPEPFALKNQLLKITFVFPDDANRKPLEKKLPASMVVQKVKGLLYRLLKVPAADLRLTYTSPKMVGTEFEIDSDLKTLQFYSIEDGDQVLVRWS
uniref:Tubulin-specific chaperone E n=1 Tax=Oreochromis niloticus TaxID=8128 RepID=A0A669DGA4_ORENI